MRSASNRRVYAVNGPLAANRAQVRLYRVRKNGSLDRIRTAYLSRYGNQTWVIRDSAKRAFTTYTARVLPTDITTGDHTPKRRIR